MVKKISAVVLAGMLSLPAAAFADVSQGSLEDRIEALTRELNELKAQMEEMKEDNEELAETVEEDAERWNLSSRFQWSGDFRSRIDWVDISSPSFYSPFEVATGVVQVLNAGSTTNMNNLLTAFGMDANTPLANFAGAIQVTPQANFIAAAEGAGLTNTEANTLAAIFYNQSVGNLLGGMPAGTTIGAILPFFGNAEALTGFMRQIPAADRKAIFANMGFNPVPGQDFENDTLWTNRLRLNIRVKAMENVEFKGRLAMYKAWGMQNNPLGQTPFGPSQLNAMSFDGSRTRQPDDSALYVDRAFVNWNNIAGLPMWFSIGRRPTTDGPPEQLRMGLDQKMATPVAFMNYPFDGISLGYAYYNLFGMADMPGRVRFCYGRGYEAGLQQSTSKLLDDTDFAGINWDILNRGNRFLNFQSFGAFNIMNVPDNVAFPNPIEAAETQDVIEQLRDLADIQAGFSDGFLDNASTNGILDRANLGNIFHTSAVYMDKVSNLNYFVTLGWSHTDPKGMDELGNSLLGSFWENPEKRDGYAVYVGTRYDMDEYGLKLGLEYNYGTEYWIAFTPGNDDLYSAKLATRGHVGEAYLIWDIPGGEAISKFSKAFIRLGYQHYEYDYTGSGFWLGTPIDVDELANDPLNAQFYAPIDSQDQVYATFEAWF